MKYLIGFGQFLLALMVLAFGLALVFTVITVGWILRFFLMAGLLIAAIWYVIWEYFKTPDTERNSRQ